MVVELKLMKDKVRYDFDSGRTRTTAPHEEERPGACEGRREGKSARARTDERSRRIRKPGREWKQVYQGCKVGGEEEENKQLVWEILSVALAGGSLLFVRFKSLSSLIRPIQAQEVHLNGALSQSLERLHDRIKM